MTDAQTPHAPSIRNASEFIWSILFFGTIWGAAEAIIGGLLYRAETPYASLPLTVIAFGVMTVARAYLPRAGSATLIASCAMLYKFFNAPFFGCHLLAILLLGVAYDLVFASRKRGNASLNAALATYLGFALFAITITYIARYPHWADAGLVKVAHYVGVAGSLAALANAIVVPASMRLAKVIKAKQLAPFKLGSKPLFVSTALLTAALWVLGATIAF